jgi:phage shock protein E
VLALALAAVGCSRSEPARTEPPAAPAPAKDPQAARARDPQAARELIASGAAVVDVRTADEYAEDHVPKAVNVPVDELSSRMAEVAALVAGDKTRPIVVYCGSGGRAAKAKRALEAAGYSRVVNGGGLDDLK